MRLSFEQAAGTAMYSVCGVRLRVHMIPGSSPTLIFLHEALGSIGQWKSFPAELCAATGCAGVVYERQGHGESDAADAERTMGFYEREAGTVLPELLEVLGVGAHVLVGHSDGATIALTYAAQHPGEARAVVSIAAHVFIEDVTLDGIRRARRAWEAADLRTKLLRYHGGNTDAVFSAWADTWLNPECREWNMFDALHAIRDPLLLVQGDRDEYGTPAQLEAIASRAGGRCDVQLIPDCGHLPMLEARDVLVARIGHFLASLSLIPSHAG